MLQPYWGLLSVSFPSHRSRVTLSFDAVTPITKCSWKVSLKRPKRKMNQSLLDTGYSCHMTVCGTRYRLQLCSGTYQSCGEMCCPHFQACIVAGSRTFLRTGRTLMKCSKTDFFLSTVGSTVVCNTKLSVVWSSGLVATLAPAY